MDRSGRELVGQIAGARDGEVLAIELPEEVLDAVAHRLAEALADRAAHDRTEPWIGVAEAAEHLNCRPQRIYSLVHQRRLHPHRDGSRLLFRRSELDAWLATNGAVERRDGIRDRR